VKRGGSPRPGGRGVWRSCAGLTRVLVAFRKHLCQAYIDLVEVVGQLLLHVAPEIVDGGYSAAS